MQILVDADACPNVIKEIIFRAAIRTKINTILFANHQLDIPRSSFVKMIRVAAGFDVADNEIINQSLPGDLVITADIPLASAVIAKQCLALDPRGQLYDENTIQQRLSTRNLMEQLRDAGIITGGPNALSKQDSKLFANSLDRLLTKYLKSPTQ